MLLKIRKYILISVIIFITANLYPQQSFLNRPVIYQPLLVIDCGVKGSAISGTCLRAVHYATRNILRSGKFAQVISLVNISFLYAVTSGKTYPVSVQDITSEKTRKTYLNYFVKTYPVERSFLMGNKNRYAMIQVGQLFLPTAEQKSEWAEYARRKKLKYAYFDEPGFTDYVRGNFNFPAGIIKIEVSEKEPWSLDDVLRLNQRLYKIKGLKQIYSPWHAFKNLTRTSENYAYSKFTSKSLGKIWELTGEFGSTYWDRSEHVIYIQFYSGRTTVSLTREVGNALDELFSDKEVAWTLYDPLYHEIRKSVVGANP
ncbi:MAG: hypothetical protein ABUK01_00075 [Leptospirales bacterium]